jgi:hypothetical protein
LLLRAQATQPSVPQQLLREVATLASPGQQFLAFVFSLIE